MEKFMPDEKVAILMEAFTLDNIAEECSIHGVCLPISIN